MEAKDSVSSGLASFSTRGSDYKDGRAKRTIQNNPCSIYQNSNMTQGVTDKLLYLFSFLCVQSLLGIKRQLGILKNFQFFSESLGVMLKF